ncbi:DUF5667 domain-containing protein [Patescibacteria group bacterium]
MKKFIITLSLISIILVPSLGLAQTKFLSEEEQGAQEQIENIENVQGNKPEGAGLVLGEKNLDLEKPANVPGDLGYSFRRFWENIIFAFTFKKISRVEYSLVLAKRRLSETQNLLNNNKNSKAKNTLKLYKKHVQNSQTNFENLTREQKDQVDIRTNNDLLNYITILSAFTENKDNGSSRDELNSALDLTVEFQRDIGL